MRQAGGSNSDVQAQLRSLPLEQLCSALDQVGERLVSMTGEMIRAKGNPDEINEARNEHLELLGSISKELDRRCGDGYGGWRIN